jgi:hypothetical protein
VNASILDDVEMARVPYFPDALLSSFDGPTIASPSYQVLTLPSAVLEMLSFSQKSPVEFPISPTANLRGIFAPSSNKMSATEPYSVGINSPRDLGGLPIMEPISVSTHPGQQLYVSIASRYGQLISPVDLKASVLGSQCLGQSDYESFADTVRILLETCLGFLLLPYERLGVSDIPAHRLASVPRIQKRDPSRLKRRK